MTRANADWPLWERREDERREQARSLLERVEAALPRAREILTAHRVREAYLYGSMSEGAPRPASDVDVAVSGCPAVRFYRLAAELERAFALPFDLVDLDRAPADFVALVRQTGRRVFP